MLYVFATVTMLLSLYYGFRLYWHSRESRLIQILYRDGAFYFVTIALMSIANGVVAMAARVSGSSSRSSPPPYSPSSGPLPVSPGCVRRSHLDCHTGFRALTSFIDLKV